MKISSSHKQTVRSVYSPHRTENRENRNRLVWDCNRCDRDLHANNKENDADAANLKRFLRTNCCWMNFFFYGYVHFCPFLSIPIFQGCMAWVCVWNFFSSELWRKSFAFTAKALKIGLFLTGLFWFCCVCFFPFALIQYLKNSRVQWSEFVGLCTQIIDSDTIIKYQSKEEEDEKNSTNIFMIKATTHT